MENSFEFTSGELGKIIPIILGIIIIIVVTYWILTDKNKVNKGFKYCVHNDI